MASLVEQIQNDLKDSLKSKDFFRAGVLRLLLASLHLRAIEKRSKTGESVLTDEETLLVLQKEASKRKEATRFYVQGGRQDLAQKETEELKILGKYLPPELGEEEVRKIIRTLISRLPDEKNFGKLMGEAMKELKGKADAKLVSEILKSEIQ